MEERRERLVDRLIEVVRADERLVALWLQGSLADGSADAWSDVDAYLAVRDDAYDDVYTAGPALAARVGDVLVHQQIHDLRAVTCLMEGPVKLDLFFERESAAGERKRPATRLLVDKAGVGPRLLAGWAPPEGAAARMIERLFLGTFQGGAWPLRMLGRGQWTTLAMTELELVNDGLVMLMAVQIDPSLLFKNRLSLPRLLPEPQRAEVESIGWQVMRAVTARDLPAILAAHLRIVDAYFREGRAAHAALGIAYPLTDAAEAAIRAFYPREWPAG